jgi:hypothetical protein
VVEYAPDRSDTSALPAIDHTGRLLPPGDLVRLRRIPIWLLQDLPDAEAARLCALEGSIQSVLRCDDHGYLWIASSPEDQEGWFCVRPDDVEKID